MTKQKKLIVICSAVVALFVAVCVVMGIVYNVRINSGSRTPQGWENSAYTAQSTIGEIEIDNTDYVRKIRVNSQEVKISREHSESENCGHFVYGDANYYIVIAGKDDDLFAFLYVDGDELQFVEKLICTANNG